MSQINASRALHLWAITTLAMTIVLTVGLGGVVTSTETGMAYPTWPNINAQGLFNFFYGSLAEDYGTGSALEHTHRQAGALVGMLAIGCLIVALCRRKELVRMSALVLALITTQGALGAFRVLGNTQSGAIIHAVGAQVVIVALVVLVKRSNPQWTGFAPSANSHSPEGRLRFWADFGLVLLFFNLLAAASLRHKAGAFSGHLVLALTASFVLFVASFRAMHDFHDRKRLIRAARGVNHTIGLQLGLGLATWAFLFGPLAEQLADERTRFLVQTGLASSHLVLGVVLMAAATNLSLESRRA
ncbi:MAG: COX15/CtaA family protein [Planctomycetes bacterium]|nr:COX15/CtaA family protein [Planctomycetota bacterium]